MSQVVSVKVSSRYQISVPRIARERLNIFPNLILADVTRDEARRAAQLRARHNVRPAVALQVATALVHRATAFVTNDRRLACLSPELDVIALDDFVVTWTV